MTTNSEQEKNREPELSSLEWQAFLFLSGEMNPADAIAFEAQLSNPETAAAVSRVSSLDAAVFDAFAAAPSQPTATIVAPVQSGIRSSHSPGSQGWVVLASLAACVAIVVTALQWSGTSAVPGENETTIADTSIPAVVPSEIETEEFALADRWSSLPIDTLESEELLDELDEPAETLEIALADLSDPMLDDVESEKIVPDWMYAAFRDDSTGVFVE